VASILTSQTPANTDAASAAISVGTVFTSAVAGNVTGVRIYRANSSLGSPSGALYSWTNDTSGTLLASKAFGTIATNAWTTILFDSPVAISASTRYVAVAGPCTAFQSTNNFFTSAVTNGDLTGIASSAGNLNGKYLETAGLAYPTQSYLSSCYFVDVIFEAVTFLPKQASTALQFF
jgi:hypothetical protein